MHFILGLQLPVGLSEVGVKNHYNHVSSQYDVTPLGPFRTRIGPGIGHQVPQFANVMSFPSSRKRNRTIGDWEPASSSWARHPELYICDGSISILCENTLFKVPGGILAMNSHVFKDMLTLGSSQPSDAETYDGCPLVRLTDKVKDLEAFMKALFVVEYVNIFPSLCLSTLRFSIFTYPKVYSC